MLKLNMQSHLHSLPLVGQAVLVRQLEEGDLSECYVSWLNDANLMQYSNQRFLSHNLDSVRTYFDSFQGSANAFLAIEDRLTQRHVGTMTVYAQPYHHTVDVGVLVGEGGQGYGKEAWLLVMDWLLTVCKVRKVTAGTLECNHAMMKLATYAGMHHEGMRVGQELVDGQPQNMHYYAKFSNS